jgi:hypothetical protein
MLAIKTVIYEKETDFVFLLAKQNQSNPETDSQQQLCLCLYFVHLFLNFKTSQALFLTVSYQKTGKNLPAGSIIFGNEQPLKKQKPSRIP